MSNAGFGLGDLKLNKNKYYFRCMSASFSREIILRSGVKPNPKTCSCLKNATHNNKKEIQSFIVIMKYLCKVSPSTVETCKPHQN